MKIVGTWVRQYPFKMRFFQFRKLLLLVKVTFLIQNSLQLVELFPHAQLSTLQWTRIAPKAPTQSSRQPRNMHRPYKSYMKRDASHKQRRYKNRRWFYQVWKRNPSESVTKRHQVKDNGHSEWRDPRSPPAAPIFEQSWHFAWRGSPAQVDPVQSLWDSTLCHEPVETQIVDGGWAAGWKRDTDLEVWKQTHNNNSQ